MTQTTQNNYDWSRAVRAALCVGAALTIEHIVLYDEQAMRDEPERTLLASNILGTVTIAGGVLLAAPTAEEAARHIVIAAIGGTVVLGLRIVRRELRLRREIGRIAYQAIGLGRGVRQYGQPYGSADRAPGRN